MFEPADFLAESLRWAARVLTGGGRRVPSGSAAGGRAGTRPSAAARFFADGKLHGAAPAPYRAIDLVAAARGRTRDEGFAAEDEALADLLLSEELRGRAVRLRPDPEAGPARGRAPRTSRWPGR